MMKRIMLMLILAVATQDSMAQCKAPDSTTVIVRVKRDGDGKMSQPKIVRSGGVRRDKEAMKICAKTIAESKRKKDPYYYLQYTIK